MTIETGLGTNFWEIPYNKIKSVVTNGWISTLWEFLSEIDDIKVIRMDDTRNRAFRFEGDQYLMRLLLLTLDHVSGNDIKTFNYCRLFLKVELLSDIITADGKAVRHDIWMGQTNAVQTIGIGEWPQQP
jgi:hypothetical protein